MEELVEGIFRPIIKLILLVLRFLQFLAWDLLVTHVGWSIGWFFYRTITLGHFPNEGLDDLDNCSWGKALIVELTGLGLLAGAIMLLSALL